MKEIDFQNPNYDDLLRFSTNLLDVTQLNSPREYEAKIAYFSTATQVGLAKKASESMASLTHEVDQSRSAVARGLEKLTLAINSASETSERATLRLEKQSARMVGATWGLVLATVVLAMATVLLVFYTRQLIPLER
jgi:hypothetical protein